MRNLRACRAIVQTSALLCLAMAGLCASTSLAGPIDDPRTAGFYTPSQALPAGPHGTLIRSRPFISGAVLGMPIALDWMAQPSCLND